MKNKLILCIIAVLLLAMLAACGQNVSQKRIDELKEEVMAELEAANNDVVDKSIEDIIKADGPKKALDFFEQQYESLNAVERKDMLAKIILEIGQRSTTYTNILEKIEQDDMSIPPLMENEEWLYKSVYDFRSNTLYLDSLSSENRNAIKKILTDEAFIVTKLYYIDQGNIEDLGFTAIIPCDISSKLKEFVAMLGVKIDFYDYELTRYPNTHINSADTRWEPSGDTYDMVYIESKDNLKLLLPGSKTEAYLKVNIHEGKKPAEKLDNDLSQGYTYTVDNDILTLKYNNTGIEVDLVKPRQSVDDDVTSLISNIQNIHKSHDGTSLFFEVPAFAVTNAIHVVDLITFEEKYFTDGFFIQNVGKEPYMDAVIVQKLPMTDSGRIAIYYVMDATGNEICEIGPTLDTENLIEQIIRADKEH